MKCDHSHKCAKPCDHAEDHDKRPQCDYPCGCYLKTECVPFEEPT